MKKNESKTTELSAAAAEQPENTQPVDTAETPDTQPEAGAGVEGPADTPSDGEGCEGVTVIIVTDNESHGVLMARSVKKNLAGVNADIHLIDGEHLRNTLAETLTEHLPYVKTERIVLMTEGMIILNPVTLGDIACVKAMKTSVLNYNINTPVLMHKSALEALLSEAAEAGLEHIDVVDTYFKGVLPEGFSPITLGFWQTDPWLLRVISKNPSIEAVKKFGWKKFMHVGRDSWSDDMMKFLEDRYPEA